MLYPPPDDQRSALMSRVKGKNTKPEILVRKLLHSVGGRFRLHGKKLPGKPDIVMPGRRLAIFVHGCFWHRHQGCKRSSCPKTRADFWEDKFRKNVARDQRNISDLKRLGWAVEVVWECETVDTRALSKRLKNMLNAWPLNK